MKKWIYNCFGLKYSENNKDESIQFNKIKKIIVSETDSKFPDINDKWKVIHFFDKVNNICESVLGDTIEFIIQNPSELPCKNTSSIKYKINMFNKKTKIILNRLIFNFKYDTIEKSSLILIIKPGKHECISSNHWNFIHSVFNNMAFHCEYKYHQY